MTTYALRDIRPNPFRNIGRYPINREKIEALKASIGRTDFWDNLVARIAPDGKPEIAYGHHRWRALLDLYPADHQVSLIVRDLDDAAMLHIMADENMTEWAAKTPITVETVRAVRDFLNTSTSGQKYSHPGQPPKTNSGAAILAFLGKPWNEYQVTEALAIINAETEGILEPDDTADLPLQTARVMRQSVSRIHDPIVRREAIGAVRQSIARGGGKAGIPDVVRTVREAHAPAPAPKVPAAIAKGTYADIDNFWRVAINVNGRTFTRPEIIRLIAENRDADELTKTTYGVPWAEQIALALDEMADTAQTLAKVLRAENAVEVAS